MEIRRFRDEDEPAVTRLVVQLQDAEHEIDARSLPGSAVEAWYLDRLRESCAKQEGRILVAAEKGRVVGFVCVLARVLQEDKDEADYHYALVSDLAVDAGARGRGIGRVLLAAGEAYAREKGARWLRIAVMAANAPAGRLYEATGFEPLILEMEKPLEG